MGFFDRLFRRDSQDTESPSAASETREPGETREPSKTRGPGELLNEAIEAGDATTVASMLANDGINPDATLSDDWTPLCLAVLRGHVAVVDVLLKVGANPALPGGGGRAPIVIAAARKSSEALQALVSWGVDLNSVSPASGTGHDQHTALFAAVGAGSVPNVQLLLAAGVDPFQQDPDGRSALYLALHRAGGDPSGRRVVELVFDAMSSTRGLVAAADAQVTALLDLYEQAHTRVTERPLGPARRSALALRLHVMSPFIAMEFIHSIGFRASPLLGGQGGEDEEYVETDVLIRRFEQWQPVCDVCKEVIGAKWHYDFESIELVEGVAIQCPQCRLFACIKHIKPGANGNYPPHNRCGSKFKVLYPGPASVAMVAQATRDGVYGGAVAPPESLSRPVITP